MRTISLADKLWGQQAKVRYLLIASLILLFTCLGAREIWTQEHRWADIVSGMFYRHDFLHPYLGQNNYYDKPLLSYWLIALIAQVSGQLSTWALRLPSALSAFLAIWAIYRLGATLKDRSLGLLSGWLMLTSFYFIFWARVSSADMLNLAGSLCAITWYFEKRTQSNFINYAVFFMIVALTSLCKGLVGAVIPMIAILVDMVLQKSIKQHLKPVLFLALIPAAIIYVLPFWISSHVGGANYGENGLYMVYRENILRYFQPFDHQGPIYTYLIYLPLYIFPWALFFIPALFALKSRWSTLSLNSKWIAWSLLLVFLFFTFSGSRRSYYVLPMVPFAILFTADWILSSHSWKRSCYTVYTLVTMLILLFLFVDLAPAWYYARVGSAPFAAVLKKEVVKPNEPWQSWNIVLLDAESKLNFYLQLPPTTQEYQIVGTKRAEQTTESLTQAWPILLNKPAHTIFITRKRYAPLLASTFTGYRLIELPAQPRLGFLNQKGLNEPIAFVAK